MSKVLITADIHFGLAQKLDDILWSVRTIREYAKSNGIDTVIVLGDLFHDRVNIDIEVLNVVLKFFEDTKFVYNQEWIVFPGNHDLYMRYSWDITTLKPLKDLMTVIDDIKLLIINDKRFWVVPFVHYESVYMEIINKIEEQYEVGDVLLTHIGVHNATLNECFLVKNWSTVSFDNSKFDLVFAGHFHCHQNVDGRRNVWYPGSPIPFRFDEGMVPHGFIEYDIETRDVKFVEIFELNIVDGRRPPDYITITDDMIDEDIDIEHNNIQVKFDKDLNNDNLTQIRDKLISKGALSVKLQKIKEASIDIDDVKNLKLGVSLNSPINLFNSWVDHDKPKDFDIARLKRMNEKIINSI